MQDLTGRVAWEPSTRGLVAQGNVVLRNAPVKEMPAVATPAVAEGAAEGATEAAAEVATEVAVPEPPRRQIPTGHGKVSNRPLFRGRAVGEKNGQPCPICEVTRDVGVYFRGRIGKDCQGPIGMRKEKRLMWRTLTKEQHDNINASL